MHLVVRASTNHSSSTTRTAATSSLSMASPRPEDSHGGTPCRSAAPATRRGPVDPPAVHRYCPPVYLSHPPVPRPVSPLSGSPIHPRGRGRAGHTGLPVSGAPCHFIEAPQPRVVNRCHSDYPDVLATSVSFRGYQGGGTDRGGRGRGGREWGRPFARGRRGRAVAVTSTRVSSAVSGRPHP